MPKPIDTEARMSLFEHLQELRSRLFRCVGAILALGVASLTLARPIFGLLMRPVLDALPPESRALIYTSGIEEINVLMKVGLYCGVFLATPVILWQLWGFIAPGLYPAERRFASPFIVLGSVAFLAGTSFCYFAVLPTMFQFLLQSGDSGALSTRLEQARAQEEEVLRYLKVGEPERAADLAKSLEAALTAEGEGQVDVAGGGGSSSEHGLELSARVDALGRLWDASQLGLGTGARPALRKVLEKRVVAREALGRLDLSAASKAVDEAAVLLIQAVPSQSLTMTQLWQLESTLAKGKARYTAQTWTKPMLTMSEQLSLVLLLELAFGIIFELPLVMAVLGVVGLLKTSWLMKYQRHAFVVCLVAAAIITPTSDAVNLALMTVPMLLCFELGVLAVWLVEKRKKAIEVVASPPGPPPGSDTPADG